MQARKFDVVALGEAMVEFNQTTAGQPNYLQGFGGDTSNAVIAAARAGASTAYLTRLGGDTFGQSLMALWAAENVSTAAVQQDSEASTGTVVPIAFPIIAGSGTLTTVMSLKANFEQQYILIGILVNLLFVFLVLHLLKWIERILGKAGLIVVRKFFGVILLAISVKIFGSNLAAFGK